MQEMTKKRQNNHTCTVTTTESPKMTTKGHKETHKDTLDGESGTKAHIDTK